MMIATRTSATSRPTRGQARGPSRRALRVRALFGWGSDAKDEQKSWKEQEKEDAWQAQQELLAKRKTGDAIKEANVRRAKVKDTVAERKAVRKNERDQLAQGVMPETLRDWKPYKKEEDAVGWTKGIVIPLNPLGLRQFDEGERFDLRSPYADDGWVDPEETDMLAGFKNWGSKLLNFTGKEPETQQGKPIIWASEYEKYKRNKNQDKDKQ